MIWKSILLQGLPGLGQVLGNATNSTVQTLSLAIYIIPGVVILFFVYLYTQRKKVSASGQNIALIYSMKQNFISGIKPFKVVRVYDKIKNVEETKAIFPDDVKKQGTVGIRGFISFLLGQQKQDKTPEEEEGAVFSETLATYSKVNGGWYTIYSLESNTQLPLVTIDKKVANTIYEMERNVERRVSRLKAAQTAITNYVSASTPLQQFGAVQIISVILLFIALIALAYSINTFGTTINNVSPVINHLAQILQGANTITGGK